MTPQPTSLPPRPASDTKKRAIALSSDDDSERESIMSRKRHQTDKPQQPLSSPASHSVKQTVMSKPALPSPKPTTTASPHPSPKKQVLKPGTKQQNLMGMFAKITCMW